jgi:hypothetical protein
MDTELMALRYDARTDLATDQRTQTSDYPAFDIFIATHGLVSAEAWQDRETGEVALFYPAEWDIAWVPMS